MSFTRKVNALVYQYNINKEELQIVAENKDLGVIFDKSLSFNPHINELLAIISKKLGFIIRNSRDFTHSKVTRILYNACVLSKLEYGRLVWNPCYVTTCESIEKLQKRFLKYLSFREDGIYPAVGTPYAELLLRHNFVSLDNRRKVHSLVFLFKLLNNSHDCPELLERLNFNCPKFSTRNAYTFYLNVPRTNLLLHSPMYSMCKCCNDMQERVDIFNTSISCIKKTVMA
nr:unnamed protein product [Callosobruchus chinensis]